MKAEAIPTRSPARELVDFLHGLSSDTVPASVIDAAKACLLDTLGCALFGYEEAWAKIMADEMLAEGSRGHSTIVGHAQSIAAPAAALCNGTAGPCFEPTDHFDAAIVHGRESVLRARSAAEPSLRRIRCCRAGSRVRNTHQVGLAMARAFGARLHKTALDRTAGRQRSKPAGDGLEPTGPRSRSRATRRAGHESVRRAAPAAGWKSVARRSRADRGCAHAQLAARGVTAPHGADDVGLLEVVRASPPALL